MKLERLISVLLAVMMVSPVCAGSDVSQEIKTAWGILEGTVSKCNQNEVDSENFCVSTDYPTSVTNKDDGMCAEKHKDPVGMHIWVATHINDNGARFCPMYVRSYRQGSDRPEDYYFTPSDPVYCFWVCSDGFGGEECAENYKAGKANVLGCDAPVSRDILGEDGKSIFLSKWGTVNKGSIQPEAGFQHDDSFPRFYSEALHCKASAHGKVNGYKPSDSRQRHTVVLIVKTFDENGYGVVAQPLQVRAFGKMSDDSSDYEWILAKPIGTSKRLCRSGYQYSSDGSACVPIDTQICETNKACDDWKPGRFPSDTYKTHVLDGKGCYEFRCKQAGYAFRGDPVDMAKFDATCVECPRETHTVTASGYCFKNEPVDPATGTVNTVNRDGEVTSVQMTGVTLQMMKDATAQIADDNSSKSCWMSHYESADDFRDGMFTDLKDTGLLKQ